MDTWVWVLIIVVAVLVVAGLVVSAMARRRRTAQLRDQFGPEYDRTVEERDNRRAAEGELRNRQKHRSALEIRPLSEPARMRYLEQWRQLQEQFVDQPAGVVVAADSLVQRVMGEEGYPMENFDAQAEVISVDHPQLVSNFRTAHAVCQRAQTQQASTEDMRTAMLNYRSLFEELLSGSDGQGYDDPR